MALARGPAADYDGWAEIVGDESWKWKNILPLMREVGLKISRNGNCLTHGCVKSSRTLIQHYLHICPDLLLRNGLIMESLGKPTRTYFLSD